MYKAKKIIGSILLVIISVSSIFLIKTNYSFTIYPKKEYNEVLSIWQIDTFSGGKGSRTSFLRNVANNFSKKHPETLFLVVNHSVESASKSISEGKMPDIISYGGCGFDFIEKFTKLKDYDIVDGNYDNNSRYAVSWCRGGYFIIKKGNGQKVIIQDCQGGNVFLSLISDQVKVNTFEIHNEEYAYSLFLRSKDATLIGNQRNIVRLIKAGVEFESTPINTYSDLYQYLSVMTSDNKKLVHINVFIDYLLSEEVQKKLVDIAMFSVTNVKLYNDNEHFSAFENTKIQSTTSPFLQLETIEKLKNQSKASFLSKEKDADLVNYIKYL